MVAGWMTSHFPNRSRSWPRYTWTQTFQNSLEIDARFKRTTNRKWHGESNGHMIGDDVTWPYLRHTGPLGAWRRLRPTSALSSYYFILELYKWAHSLKFCIKVFSKPTFITPIRSHCDWVCLLVRSFVHSFASLQPDQDYGTVCQDLCVNPRHWQPSRDN